MAQLYTSAERLVRPGHEEEFVSGWRDLAEWTFREMDGNSRALLLRDRWSIRRYVSLGAWESLEAIQRWRADPGFQLRAARMRAVSETYVPSTFEQVLDIGVDR